MQGQDTDRTKLGDADYKVVCLQCDRTFEARRSDATFCSARCRVAYSREPAKREKFIKHLHDLSLMLDRQAVKYQRSKVVFDAMRDLRNSLDASLARFEEAP